MPRSLCLSLAELPNEPFVVRIIHTIHETAHEHSYKVVFIGCFATPMDPTKILNAAFYRQGSHFYSTMKIDFNGYNLQVGERSIQANMLRYLMMAFTTIPRLHTEPEDPRMLLPFFAQIVSLERKDDALNVRFMGFAQGIEGDVEKVTGLMRQLVFQDCNYKECDAALFYNPMTTTWQLKGYANIPYNVVVSASNATPILAGGGAHRRRLTLEKLTVKELRKRCARRGVPHRGKRKAELVAALRRKRRAT